MTDKECACTDATWCSFEHDVDELKARADAREGLLIELTLNGDVWEGVHTVNGEPDPWIVCLFGSHILPLPYTRFASGDMMTAYREQLAKTFPNTDVRFDFEREMEVMPFPLGLC